MKSLIIFLALWAFRLSHAKPNENDENFVNAMKNVLFGGELQNPLLANLTGRINMDMAEPGLLPVPNSFSSVPAANLSPQPLPQISQSSSFGSYPFMTISASTNPCSLPQQIGTGPYRIPRWYFNPARMRCELFYWSGCCGNGNNFPNFQACQTVCEESPNPCAYGTPTTIIQCAPGSVMAQTCTGQQFCHVGASPQTTICCNKPANLANVDRCQQPLNVGIGNANLQRWYYNPLSQNCQTCVYKGLQGNENNFITRADCENSCIVNPCARGVPYKANGVTVQCSITNQAVCPAGYYCHFGADMQTTVCCQALGGDPCGQPMDRGRGSSQLPRWYWDENQQCCLPFMYCGQKGTQNNFLTKEDCERTCFELDNPCALGPPQMVSSTEPQLCTIQNPNTCGPNYWCHFGAVPKTTLCCPGKVEGQAICEQPMSMGSGEASLQRWYYDPNQKCCVQFVYKGRYGNQNNFLTLQECQQTCIVSVNVCPFGEPLLGQDNRPVTCTFGSNSCGPSHWCHLGLVPDEYQCCPGEPTNPGACQGLPEIDGEPGPPGVQPQQRWYYNAETMTCVQFVYNGRKGNQNNFLTKEDCEATCPVQVNPCTVNIPLPPEFCTPNNQQTCSPGSWCHVGAGPQTTLCCPNAIENVCSLPLARGEGDAMLERWYYDTNAFQCLPFTYVGLKGNQNNFQTREDCEKMCAPNPCPDGSPVIGADGKQQTCSPNGNVNSCPTSYWCHIGSDATSTVCCPGASPNPCLLPMSTGEGGANLERFYFDPNSKTCKPFIYGGLKGNQNNFLSLRACQLQCQPLDNPCIGQPATTPTGQVLFCSATNRDVCPVNFWCHLGATPETTVCCPGPTNPCSVPLAPGTGNAGIQRYYYNPDDRQCLPFQYNGKRGNQNNFLTLEECSRTCPAQLCLLSIDRGACAGRQTRYAFNRQSNTCVQFEYTGCGGNLNNFQTMVDCMQTCGNIGFRR